MKDKDKDLKNWLHIISGLIIFSFCAPLIFTQFSIIDFRDTGQIGDTIGGIMNPFISIAAVIVTGLAFYAQYKANDMVKKQFEIEKFENQFYEMLRLHKENVNEIEIQDTDGKGTNVKGRKAFYKMKLDFQLILSENIEKLNKNKIREVYNTFFWDSYSTILKGSTLSSIESASKINKKNYHVYLGHYYRHLYYTVKFVVEYDEDIVSENKKMNYLKILRAQLSNYEQEMLFYNWLCYGEDWEQISYEEKVIYLIDDNKNKEYIKTLKDIYMDDDEIEEKNEILINVIDTFLTNENPPKENENIENLKNQIKEIRKKQNQFFTKYRIIHNLWYGEFLEKKDIYLKTELKILVKRYNEIKENNSSIKKLLKNKTMFELGDERILNS